MSTKAELLADVDVNDLPATRVAEQEMTDEPLADVGVGDKVVVWSRNANRIAVVLEATPKRVMVAYTTEGAWKDAQKIYEQTMVLNPDERARMAGKQAGSNYDYHVRESDLATATLAVATAWRTEKKAAEEREQHRAIVAAETREEWIKRHEDEGRESTIRAKEKAREGGVSQYVTVTTKSVKREFVFGLKAAP